MVDQPLIDLCLPVSKVNPRCLTAGQGVGTKMCSEPSMSRSGSLWLPQTSPDVPQFSVMVFRILRGAYLAPVDLSD